MQLNGRSTPMVSIILCTYNPDRVLLKWALDSVQNQTLPKSEFELVVVDNNSEPPVSESEVKGDGSFHLRLMREPRQGLTFSRCAGIKEAKGDLLVFVDDDNHLAPDYLEKALQIAGKEPQIGLYGGISKGVMERSVPGWKEILLPYLGVRDYGSESITSNKGYWGKWEPIGAGMVSRRDVADGFVRFIEDTTVAGELGRKGKGLLSGEDSLFARVANGLGYSCSYQPALKLSHHIKPSRLKFSCLARTLNGHGRSFVILQRVTGKEPEKIGWVNMHYVLMRRFFSRIRSWGLRAGIVHWSWDLGYMRESRNGSFSPREKKS